MSELPETLVAPEVLSSEERFAKYFPGLSKQAVLNMLIAYRPYDLESDQLLRHRDAQIIASTMSRMYSRMLESLQDRTQSRIDLTGVTDDELQMVSNYFKTIEPILQKEKAERQLYQSVGAEVVHLADRRRV